MEKKKFLEHVKEREPIVSRIHCDLCGVGTFTITLPPLSDERHIVIIQKDSEDGTIAIEQNDAPIVMEEDNG